MLQGVLNDLPDAFGRHERHFGIDVEDALIEASRLFGIKSMRAQLKAVMNDELQDLLKRHEIELRNERLYAEKEKPAVIG